MVVVDAADYLRPASLRLEFGHTDPDMFLDGWLDVGGLRREVLEPAEPDGSGRVLPRLWDAAADRAHRDRYVDLPADGVVVLAGALLLGRGLPLDLAVHLRMSEQALARRLPADERWTLPAYARYDGREHAREDRGSAGAGRPSGPSCGAEVRRQGTVGEEGVEPSRPYGHTDLNRARLPFRHSPWRSKS